MLSVMRGRLPEMGVEIGAPRHPAKLDLGKLPVGAGAAFNSHKDNLDARCHPDTRVDLLGDIYKWAEDVDGECIFWLTGIAGTGKSTAALIAWIQRKTQV
jgi:hypothetical protein